MQKFMFFIYVCLMCLFSEHVYAKVYVQYDASTADASNHVYFSTVMIPDGPNAPPAPKPPSNITQIAYPDSTIVSGMMIDLSQDPPTLIPVPPPVPLSVAITSSDNPELNGSYAIDPQSLANMNAIATYGIINKSFPGGASTLPWQDVSGAVHIMPSIQKFNDFSGAIATYVTAMTICQQSGCTSPPSNRLTIP